MRPSSSSDAWWMASTEPKSGASTPTTGRSRWARCRPPTPPPSQLGELPRSDLAALRDGRYVVEPGAGED
mgnify:CR=1 FL=1